MEILIIFALVLLNGIFAMSELSLVSSRKYKLEKASKNGNKGAKKAIELSENPSKFLSTVQIGITLIGIILGFYSGDALSNDFAAFISKIYFLEPYANQIAGPVIVIFITYLSIVLGELFPKQLGMIFPEKIAVKISRPMDILSKITSPFVWLLSATNSLLMKIFGIKKLSDNQVSEEEIKAIIKESAEVGEIEDIEHDIVKRVFELGDTKAAHLFTYRNQIHYLKIQDSKEEILKIINENPHSIYPLVEENNLDKIKGVVTLKDIFGLLDEPNFEIKKIVKTPVYLTENTSAYKILESFRQKKIHFGIVVDEYGSTEGIITMDDLMDALVGDMSDEMTEEISIQQRDENSWLVDGQVSLKHFMKEIPIEIDEIIAENILTIAGFVIHENKGLPKVGDRIKFDNFEFEILDKDGQRIDKILVKKR